MRALPSREYPTIVLDGDAVLCVRTVPLVILGGFGSAVWKFSSRIQLAASFVDSSACSTVSKRPM